MYDHGMTFAEAITSRPEEYPCDRELLYAEFAPLVGRLIRQYGLDAEMRQDLAGEIYYRFCVLVEVYEPSRGIPLRPYLVRQLSAAIYTYARQQWSIRHRETAWEMGENDSLSARMSEDPTASWIADLSRRKIAASVMNALSRLSQRQRKVIIWRYYQERTFEEIAQLLGIREASVRSLLRHGISALRKHIRLSEEEAI